MGEILFPAEPFSWTDNQYRCQCSGPTGHMHHQASGKIKYTIGTKRSHPASSPYPVTDRIIHKDRPKNAEHDKRSKTDPLGKGAGNQSRSYNSKHALVYHENRLRYGCRVIRTRFIGHTPESKPGEIAYNTSHIRTERHCISDVNPFN